MGTIYDFFFLFGDSLIQHAASQEQGYSFTSALQDAYIRRMDIMNRGFSGYTTTQALKVLPHIISPTSSCNIRFIAIFFGANDSVNPDSQTGQHVPLPVYKANLIKIVTHPSLEAHRPRIILITPPPIDEHQLEIRDREKGYDGCQRSAWRTKDYADACKEVGDELGVAVLDLWGAIGKKAGWAPGKAIVGSKEVPKNKTLAGLLHDGLHLSGDGYRLLFDEMMKLIRENWNDQTPERLPFVLPSWDDSTRWSGWN